MAAFERLEPQRGHSHRHSVTTVLDLIVVVRDAEEDQPSGHSRGNRNRNSSTGDMLCISWRKAWSSLEKADETTRIYHPRRRSGYHVAARRQRKAVAGHSTPGRRYLARECFRSDQFAH